jgi:biopolymer transport protein ExbB
MLELFVKGGFLMWPLLACSVLALAIVLAKLFFFYQIQQGADELSKEVLDLVQQQKFSEAIVVCQRSNSPLARVFVAVLHLQGRSREQIKTIAGEVASREGAPLEHYMGLLSTIATISPLLGLLGTVLGMIEAFTVIAAQGVGTPATLGGGISQALVTTAAGLTVAIPVILAHRYLSGRVNRISVAMEEYILRIVDLIGKS